jgi:hypothetical protein
MQCRSIHSSLTTIEIHGEELMRPLVIVGPRGACGRSAQCHRVRRIHRGSLTKRLPLKVSSIPC